MQSPEQPRGFERAQEFQRESYAEVAGDYSSEAQARAAAQLVETAARHKEIDKELAGRARAMLREMIDTGGDLDLDAVHALVDEAEQRYAIEDAATDERLLPAEFREEEPTEPNVRAVPDETAFFKVPLPARRGSMPVHELSDPLAEERRARLVAIGAMDETGHVRQRPAELGLTQKELDAASALQGQRYMSDAQYGSAQRPRQAS